MFGPGDSFEAAFDVFIKRRHKTRHFWARMGEAKGRGRAEVFVKFRFSSRGRSWMKKRGGWGGRGVEEGEGKGEESKED